MPALIRSTIDRQMPGNTAGGRVPPLPAGKRREAGTRPVRHEVRVSRGGYEIFGQMHYAS
jgi:hypothetical protein